MAAEASGGLRGANRAQQLIEAFGRGNTLRVVNFHNTTPAREAEYRAQFEAFAGRFLPCAEEDVIRWFEDGRWHKSGPGLIPVFYEGYRNNYEIGLPLAEEYGFVAWFFVPSAFPGTAVTQQTQFAETNHIGLVDEGGLPIAMSWAQLADVEARGHVVASHTRHHAAVRPESEIAFLEDEIAGSQEEFRRNLGHPARSFAWLYGSEAGINLHADRLLADAGFKLLFSNLRLQYIR